MKEQLIDFETAKLAKEKGFDIRCKDAYCDFEEQILYDYHHGDEELIEKRYNLLVSSDYDRGKTINYYVPTQSLLQKWLREKHGIDIMVKTWTGDIKGEKTYASDVYLFGTIIYIKLERVKTYEEALEKGLFEAIKLI